MINVIKKQYHWVVLFCCCLMIGGSLGLTANAYAVMYTPLCTALGVGRGQIMLHSTISNIVLGLATPFVVKLISKIKLRYIFIAGLLLVESSLFVTAFSGSLLLINIFGVIRGVGLACVYIAIVTIVLGNWFVKAGGTAIGFSLSFSGFAIVFFVPTGYQSIEKYFNKGLMEEHQIGEYRYDMQVPDFGRPPQSGSRSSWRDRIFKRGK